MGKFRIIWKKSAVKDLASLPKEMIKRIFVVIDSLGENPQPENAIKLVGTNI